MNKELDGYQEDQWERVAFRWVLGLGVFAGAWWMLFGLIAADALASARFGLAAPILVIAFLPNIVWLATKHDSRVSAWLGWLETAWRSRKGRPVARSAKVALFAGAALWTALAP